MALVKGSRKHRVKVIEYRLRYVVTVACVLLALLIAVIALTYMLGNKIGMAGQEKALADVARLNKELNLYTEKSEKLEQQLENSKTAAEIDRQSNEDVRQEVIVLKDEIARLTEENNFYRGLMAPNEKASGLTLGAVELVEGREENIYDYKVVVQQLAKRHNLLNGTLKFTVVGSINGIVQRFSLMELSDSVNSSSIKLRFKYFQVVSGELRLPTDFEPEGIEIEARSTGSKPQTVSKKFRWLVEEK